MLQDRDRQVQEADEKLAYYEDMATTFRAKVQVLEDEATYHKNKWTQLESMRRQDMIGRASQAVQVLELEKKVVDSHELAKQLQQQLLASHVEKMQLDATLTRQAQRIQLLEDKTNDQDKAVQAALCQHQESLVAEKTRTQQVEAEVVQLQRLRQVDQEQIQHLTKDMEKVQADKATAEAQLRSAHSALHDKDQSISALVEKVSALGQHLKDVQESHARMVDASVHQANSTADSMHQIQNLQVQIVQLSRARNQCIEWKARHSDRWDADRTTWLAQVTWLQLKVHCQTSQIARLRLQQTQKKATLTRVVAQVGDMKLAMASLQQFALAYATCQPWAPTIAAITMATDKVVEQRNRAQLERNTAVDRVSHLSAVLEASEASHCSMGTKLAHRQALSSTLARQLVHASTQQLALICFYNWKDVHLRRLVGRWSNAALLVASPDNPHQERAMPHSAWHLMQSEPHVDFDKIHIPFKPLRRPGVQQA
ncbi:hypothetical protein, variant [Aphanomyces astaci]|nr:hypothetical protein, variant [Aphanomyces astaci]ETV84420.1 hypothetical protein, variant [Aphanomyces astaci]|eukprot:XP_009826112.1 hypothetical protein, variant [Aphanomyces astaci]